MRKVLGWEGELGSHDWVIISPKLAAATFSSTSMTWEGQKKQVARYTFFWYHTSILD